MSDPSPTNRPVELPAEAEASGASAAGAGRHAVRRAWAMLQRGRFAEAEAILVSSTAAGLSAAIPLRLLRNLDCLENHRPELFAQLMEAGPLAAVKRYPLTQTAAGVPLASEEVPAGSGKFCPLHHNADPAAAARQALTHLLQPSLAGEPVLFADVIDGHLLSAVAQAKPTLEVGRQQPVYVVEADPHLLLSALMLHDWTGAESPLVDPRFVWFVGQDARERFAAHLRDDLMLEAPRVCLGRESQRQIMSVVLKGIDAHREARMDDWQERIAECYDQFDATALTVGVGRRPRVLLVTCRFSTVLKHVAADADQAFQRLGWRTRLVIEPGDSHRITRACLLRTLATFKPDLVFTVDMLRQATGDVFPPALPYVCWLQDQLPQFTSVEAGRSVGVRDFILSMVGPMYTGQWQYPARQIIETPKLTRPPVRPSKWRSEGDDLVYVSNASQQPADLIAALADPVLRAAAQRMQRVYEQGRSLPTMWHVGQVIDETVREQQFTLNPAARARAVNALCLPLNNALYRQQALRWVKQTADEFGLTLALYGKGWEQHPNFAAHARGPVAYGPDLERLTRNSKINLQIIPSFCLHQRLLDGLVAGGFFLVRSHPSDTLMPRLLAMLDSESQTVDEALEAAGRRRPELELLFNEARCLTDLGMPVDLVSWLRGCRRGELMTDSGVALPRLNETSFHDAATFRQAVGRYLEQPALRGEITEAQRQSVESRLSYTAGLRRTLARIGRLIADESREKTLPLRQAAQICAA